MLSGEMEKALTQGTHGLVCELNKQVLNWVTAVQHSSQRAQGATPTRLQLHVRFQRLHCRSTSRGTVDIHREKVSERAHGKYLLLMQLSHLSCDGVRPEKGTFSVGDVSTGPGPSGASIVP